MDSKTITRTLKKLGYNTCTLSTTSVRNYHTITSGDFYCRTEINHGCFDEIGKDDKFIKVHIKSSKGKEILDELKKIGAVIIRDWTREDGGEIIVQQ